MRVVALGKDGKTMTLTQLSRLDCLPDDVFDYDSTKCCESFAILWLCLDTPAGVDRWLVASLERSKDVSFVLLRQRRHNQRPFSEPLRSRSLLYQCNNDLGKLRCPLPCDSSHTRSKTPPFTTCQKLLVSHNANFQYQSLRDFYDVLSACACREGRTLPLSIPPSNGLSSYERKVATMQMRTLFLATKHPTPPW